MNRGHDLASECSARAGLKGLGPFASRDYKANESDSSAERAERGGELGARLFYNRTRLGLDFTGDQSSGRRGERGDGGGESNFTPAIVPLASRSHFDNVGCPIPISWESRFALMASGPTMR